MQVLQYRLHYRSQSQDWEHDPAMTTEIYPSSINELRIAFRSGQNTIVAAGNPIILTRFLVILQFNF